MTSIGCEAVIGCPFCRRHDCQFARSLPSDILKFVHRNQPAGNQVRPVQQYRQQVRSTLIGERALPHIELHGFRFDVVDLGSALHLNRQAALSHLVVDQQIDAVIIRERLEWR